jgi:Ca2+-binding RTX toxin-like protein
MPAVALAVAALVAAPAQAATSEFATGQDAWVGSAADCDGTGGSLCSTATVWEPTVGNPAGSISTRMTVALNLLGAFEGVGVWTSPAFTVPPGESVTKATFSYDRQLEAAALLSLTPESHVTVDLLDEAGGAPARLLAEDLTTGNVSFATRSAAVSRGAVVPGHSYRLRITTRTTTGTASLGLLGEENTRFDTVGLTVESSAGSKSLSTTAIRALFRSFNEGTPVGSGPGGALIPRRLCTIVGTARRDRLVGTRGNDVICGLGGNDVIRGGRGIDLIDGANGNDRLSGGVGIDKLIGLRGNDRLYGESGNDRVGGGAGEDVLRGGPGTDRLAARDRRRDFVDGGRGRDRATLDRVRHADRVRGLERS